MPDDAYEHEPEHEPAIILITGIMAAGKSTVAEALARRLPRAVHVRGDLFRRMVVSGRAEMTARPSVEALRQLRLRYELAATVADRYFAEGFTVVLQDIIIGPDLPAMVERITARPLLVVVLAPDPAVVADREERRAKTGYGDRWSPVEFDTELRESTPRIGLWLDTSQLSVTETVESVLSRAWQEGRVR